MKKRVLNIRLKLFIALALVSALVGILIGFKSYDSARKIIEKNTQDRLISVRNIKKVQINATISKISAQFNNFAITEEIVAAANDFSYTFDYLTTEGNLKHIESCSNAILQEYRNDYFSLDSKGFNNYSNPGMSDAGVLLHCSRVIKSPNDINTSMYGAYHKKYEMLITTFKEWQGFVDVIILDNRGNVIYSQSDNPTLGINVNELPWSKTVLNGLYHYSRLSSRLTESARIFDFTFFPTYSGQPVAFIASPIYDKDKFIGVLVGVITSAQFDTLLTSNNGWKSDGLGDTGESYIVGMDGYMRTKSRMLIQNKKSYFQILEDSGNKKIDLIEANDSDVLLQKINDSVMRKIVNSSSGVTVDKDYLGNPAIITYAPINAPYLDWGIVVEISKKEADEPIMDLKNTVIISMVLIVFVLVAVTMYLSWLITKPIHDLIKTVIEYTANGFVNRVNDDSSDEIGELSRAFDHMAGTIEERSKEIYKINASLVAEVEERKSAQFALQKEKNFISSILDSQMFIMMLTDHDNNILRTNKIFEDITGTSDGEIKSLGSPVFTGNSYTDFAGHVYSCNASCSFSAEIKDVKNETHNMNWVVSIMEDVSILSGRLLVWTGIDVTEQKKVEAKLIYNAKMLQALTSNAKDGILVVGDDNEIILWNEAAEKLFGYNINEIKTEGVRKLFIPEIPVSARDYYYENNADATIELEGVMKNGHIFAAELSMSKMTLQGKMNTLYIVRDVSFRKIKEEELRQALEKTKIAEKAKTNFLANMSHEIRTPLNGILGFLDLLKQTHLDSTQSDYLKIIDSSADSLLGVINEILDFSKIESGKMALEKVEFHVFEELEHTVDLFVAKANEKSQDIIIDVDPHIPSHLLGDPLRLRQIISNLLSNAIKFTPENGVITISSKLITKDKKLCNVRFMVEDNGIGISKEKQASIFDAFSQADDTVTRRYGGTGLGLTICTRLVSLMGSRLNIDSIEGQGSKFWFDVELPIGPGAEHAPKFKGLKVAYFKGNLTHEDVILKYLTALECELLILNDFQEISYIKDLSMVIVDYTNTSNDDLKLISELVPGSARIILAKDDDRREIKEVSSLITKTLYKPVSFTRLVDAFSEIIYGSKASVPELIGNIQFKGHVLIAEDNPVNQRLIKILLTKLGLSVDIAENGKVAFDDATSNDYDLIFMDIHMPLMDGISVTKNYIEWAKLNGKDPVPVVALTANVIEDDRKLYNEAGMQEFLAKPIVISSLIEILSKYLPKIEKQEIVNEFQRMSEELEIPDLVFLKSLVNEFISLTRVQLAQMHGFIMQENVDALLELSSSINSAATSLKLTGMMSILRRFNSYCKGGDMLMAQQLLDEVSLELERLSKII